ncbi:MAG TPA: sodium:proline symporter [Bacteroidetes bacterium]|nr:sodium:proline symporter [Bacteroidota bacterium]
MNLAIIDWVLIGGYILISLGIAIAFSSRAGKSLGEFFLGGRSLPWYVAGVSMVATTFAADTPLAVTELVAKNGISANWLWWNMLFGGMLTTFFFARLWRRADVLTEVEFIALRYGGKAAKFLRGFKAIYLGLIMNVLVMGWVNLALMALLEQFFGLSWGDAYIYTGLAMVIVALYSTLGGFMSVAITDMFQFVIAMTGSIVLAVLVLNSEKVGGIDGLKEKLGADSSVFDFFPVIGESVGGTAQTLGITVSAFIAYIGMQWWASWYPGAEPGGGGYIAQRMMSAKSEKDSIYATLFFQLAHYCLRPWPWIIVALCTLVLYPDLPADRGLGYVAAMREYLPDGLRGLLLVAFLAAYMSTISTQLNWGASYLVNDLIKPSMKDAKESYLVGTSRITTVVLMILAFAMTSQLTSISGVWAFMIECGAGLGLVLILRWFWWRINVWSEIAATIAPFFFYGTLKLAFPADHAWATFPNSYFITILGTTVTWLIVTFATKPESNATLDGFFAKVRPGGYWLPSRQRLGMEGYETRTWPLVAAWLSAVVMAYSTLFATGKLIFKEYQEGMIFLGTALLACIALVTLVRTFGLFKDTPIEKK